ncbi:hypothetical protein MSPP1_000812 [Malassezia sp. CBS 17886]|nr:hypothetical protein MSPP1_000812 [Malassezia sp. CBS 17886]
MAKGCIVYMVSRNEAKGRNALVTLNNDKSTFAGKVEFMRLDLGSFYSIENFVREFTAKQTHLDLLFNNAGLFVPNQNYETTVQGYEIHFGVNALGPYYLTELLIPLLAASHKQNPARPARVCFTSSVMHRYAARNGFDPSDPSGEHIHRFGVPRAVQAYCNSKMCSILTANKFDRKYGDRGILFISLNPGNVKTKLTRDIYGLKTLALNHIVTPMFSHPVHMGALTPLYAGTSPETEEGGGYYIPWARRGEPLRVAQDTAVQDKSTLVAKGRF